jgi:hypothetical protein
MTGLPGLFRLVASAVITGLVVAACAPRPEPDGEADGRPPADPAPGGEWSTEADVGQGILLKLAIDPRDPGAGEVLEFTLTARNTSGAELVLDFPNGQRFDFEVLNDGNSVWRWAADMFFPQMLGRERIAPGDEIVWSTSVESGFPPGRYRVRGTMTTISAETIELELDVGEGGSNR